MIEWSSSMNRITPSREASSTSAFIRFSSSPTTPAPATREDGCRATIRAPFRASGTFPAAMRWARPSTMAVFPVPAGPIRAGLRLVRRQSVRQTSRISSSLPTTGGSFPSRASRVRSRPNSSSIGVDPALPAGDDVTSRSEAAAGSRTL